MLRIHTRYLEEVVEAHELCPWAKGARQSGALARRVILDDPIGSALRAIDDFAADEKIVVAILIFPRHDAGADAFDRFVADARKADLARRTDRAPFALAAFHPSAPWGDDSPERLVMYLRRSPDPSIQLVRVAALDAVRSSAPSGKFLFDGSAAAFAELERRAQTVPVSERIARDNFERFRAVRSEMERALEDIAADRARSYARFRG